MDVVIAIDHVALLHQFAKQGQRGFDAGDDHFVERAAQPHQAFAAVAAVHDQLADQ